MSLNFTVKIMNLNGGISLAGSFLLLVTLGGCATAHKSDTILIDQIRSTSVASALKQFTDIDGKMDAPIQGKFKEASTLTSFGAGGGAWHCSARPMLDTRVIERQFQLNVNPLGQITGEQLTNDCGASFDNTIAGLQTRTGVYLYGVGSITVDFKGNPKRGERPYKKGSAKDITYFEIDRNSGILKQRGIYLFEDGVFKFNPTPQNNEQWSRLVIEKTLYKTTYAVPERSWKIVDTFETSIRSAAVNQPKNKSGFQWGKALALGVGVVAGGSLKLDTDTQANIISGIVLDSMGDTNGTDNLNAAVNNAAASTKNDGLDNVGKFNPNTGEFDFDDESVTNQNALNGSTSTAKAPKNSNNDLSYSSADSFEISQGKEGREQDSYQSNSDIASNSYKSSELSSESVAYASDRGPNYKWVLSQPITVNNNHWWSKELAIDLLETKLENELARYCSKKYGGANIEYSTVRITGGSLDSKRTSSDRIEYKGRAVGDGYCRVSRYNDGHSALSFCPAGPQHKFCPTDTKPSRGPNFELYVSGVSK